MRTKPTLHSGWKWASLLAGVLALWLSYGPNGAPYITNDGYQYLDAASNLASGRCLCTNVALFDEQVAFGHFPIPFTHFAPGYSILIAALSGIGLPAETAGYLLSAFGFLAVLWLIQEIAVGLGARPWVAAAFGLIWITHANGLFYGATVETESLFTALLLALAALIVRDVRLQGTSFALLTAIGVAAGLSYWIRYPGLFLVGGAGVYLIARLWRTPRARRGALTGLLALAVLAGSVQLRNAVYTGSWRGAFSNTTGQTPRAVVIQTLLAFFHLVVGDRVPVHFDIRMAMLLLSCGLALFFGWRAFFGSTRMKGSFEPLGWPLFIGLAYVGGVMLASMTTIAHDFPRYYLPVYPLLLACGAVACSAIASGWKAVVVVALVLSVIAVEARSLFVRPPQPDWLLTRTMLDEEVQPGVALTGWLRNHLTPDGTILAVEGQAVHYVVQRPVVAVIPPEFSVRATNDSDLHAEMRQFRSRYLLVFPGAPADRISEETSIELLRAVAAGNPPPWLKPAAHTRDAAVYECADCAL